MSSLVLPVPFPCGEVLFFWSCALRVGVLFCRSLFSVIDPGYLTRLDSLIIGVGSSRVAHQKMTGSDPTCDTSFGSIPFSPTTRPVVGPNYSHETLFFLCIFFYHVMHFFDSLLFFVMPFIVIVGNDKLALSCLSLSLIGNNEPPSSVLLLSHFLDQRWQPSFTDTTLPSSCVLHEFLRHNIVSYLRN